MATPKTRPGLATLGITTTLIGTSQAGPTAWAAAAAVFLATLSLLAAVLFAPTDTPTGCTGY
jgi:hypothetical protein